MRHDRLVGSDAELWEHVPLVRDVVDHVRVEVGIDRTDPLVHAGPAASGLGLQCRGWEHLLEIGYDGARLVEREIAMPEDRHPVEWMQRQMRGGAHFGF